MLGPFATESRHYIASHQVSLVARQRPSLNDIAQAVCDVHDIDDDNAYPATSPPFSLSQKVKRSLGSKVRVETDRRRQLHYLCAQGRRSLWDRGDVSPIFVKGGSP